MTRSQNAQWLAAKGVTLSMLLILTGCLPSSCRRTESTELLPADSLSRQIAESVPADTLRLLWTASGTDMHPLEFPRTVRFAADGGLYVSDVERGSLFIFVNGAAAREIPLPSIDIPYLAGMAGDTISVFSPSSLKMYRIVDDYLVDSTTIEDPTRSESSLVYGAANDVIYYKRIGPDQNGLVLSLTSDGRTIDSTRLPGPHWRHAGLLKSWGDTLISLSGFRPVIDLIPTSERGVMDGTIARADTLSLVGFDSPMLARSHSFMIGEIHEAPLLSASAAAAGNRLFVLNMRPGWLQVDVFDRDGKLRRRLVQSTREYQNAFFPQDIDVRKTQEGYEIAVILSEPRPEARVFQWIPDAAARSSSPPHETPDAI